VDETGLFDREEGKRNLGLGSADGGDQQLHCLIWLAVRHQTLLRCVSASGHRSCPLRLSANRGVSEIFNPAVREHIGVEIQMGGYPDMTSEIFINYLPNVLIPVVM
jgi:hypothetical protein